MELTSHVKKKIKLWLVQLGYTHSLKLWLFSCRNLSDIDQDGKLTAEEFILAMHLIDMAMSGLPLPPVLPPDYLPPTFRWVQQRINDLLRPIYALFFIKSGKKYRNINDQGSVSCFVSLHLRRVRSDSVQSDHKSTQEEAEEEVESSQEKKLPGNRLVNTAAARWPHTWFQRMTSNLTKVKGDQEFWTQSHI